MEGLRARHKGHPSPGTGQLSERKSRWTHDRYSRRHPMLYGIIVVLLAALLTAFVCFDSIREFYRNSFCQRGSSETILSDPNETVTYDFFITIYAFDRPKQLLHLLQDIAREGDAGKLKVGVNVIDDNSYGCVFPPVDENIFDVHGTGSLDLHLVKINPQASSRICAAGSRFSEVESFLRLHGWNMYISRYRHARRRHWHLVRMSYAMLHSISAELFLFLPDDDRLAKSFLSKVSSLWKSIEDSRKLTLMLHVEESRENTPVWTDLKPRSIGGSVSRIGWVESGNFLCTEDFLRFMNWSFPRVSIRRWIDNPPISSGVGSTLSELIHASGKRMYRTDKSFVAHIGVSSSKMNAQFRKAKTPALLTKYFADGDVAYQNLLMEASTVTASIASQWIRESTLHSAVESLSSQVDHLNVYLNGYDAVPAYLYAPYITAIKSNDARAKGDIGDVGKFFWCNNITTDYHLTADDDIIYPKNYVDSLVSFSQQSTSPVVVGAHGIRIKENNLNPSSGKRGMGYYGSREVWMSTEAVPDPVAVHILGTGTLIYRPIDIGEIDLDSVFPAPNMADIWFGILAQRQKLPMIVIPHEEGWLKEIPGTFEDSIYRRSTRSRSAERLQTEAAKSIRPWRLYTLENGKGNM